jgi:uncharacterized PurR-regulated membrane protein YhhQ (DUF165 family)
MRTTGRIGVNVESARAVLVAAIAATAVLDFTANLLATTFFRVGPFTAAVGTLTFALSYTLYDYIRRYHGRNATLAAVAAGALGTLAYSFAFGGGLGRIVLASLAALAAASLVDIRVQTLLLRAPLWRMVTVSNGVSLAVDTVVFTLVAFLGVEGIGIASLIAGDYLTKAVMTLVSIPLIYGLTAVVPFPPLAARQAGGAGAA